MRSTILSLFTILVLLTTNISFAQDYVDLSTPNHVLRVFEDGRLVDGNEDVAFDFIDDCDTFNVNTNSHIYLYGGSPLISYIDGTDTLLFHMYENATPEVNGFIATSPLVFDDVSSASYTYAKASFETANGAIGLTREYFAPKHTDSADFIIVKSRFFSLASPIPGTYVGTFLDWNIPSDSGTDNGSSFNMSQSMIYQHGAEYNQDDPTELLCPQESDDRYGAIWPYFSDIKNAITFSNLEYTPLTSGTVYNLMTGEEGFSVYSHSHPDSIYVDLATLVTYGGYHMTPVDTIEQVCILGVTKDGLGDLNLTYDKSIEFIADHPEIAKRQTCCVVPGDVNNDGVMNIGDAVYLITYIFKGGPPPPCPWAADTNGDCSVDIGDAIRLIDNIFRFGQPIQCAPEWCEYDL